jgi:SAM-dependent methyltransferase
VYDDVIGGTPGSKRDPDPERIPWRMAEISSHGGDALPGLNRTAEFDAAYEGTPPWDIGHPQPALVALVKAGLLLGRVLDIGCGTGEHALMAAELGLYATGIDSSPKAIQLAEEKARERNLHPVSLLATLWSLSLATSNTTPCWTAACSMCSTTPTVRALSEASIQRSFPGGATSCCALAIDNLATGDRGE